MSCCPTKSKKCNRNCRCNDCRRDECRDDDCRPCPTGERGPRGFPGPTGPGTTGAPNCSIIAITALTAAALTAGEVTNLGTGGQLAPQIAGEDVLRFPSPCSGTITRLFVDVSTGLIDDLLVSVAVNNEPALNVTVSDVTPSGSDLTEAPVVEGDLIAIQLTAEILTALGLGLGLSFEICCDEEAAPVAGIAARRAIAARRSVAARKTVSARKAITARKTAAARRR